MQFSLLGKWMLIPHLPPPLFFFLKKIKVSYMMFCTELCACSIEKYCFNFPGHLFPNLQSFDKHLLCFTSACVQTRTFGGGSNARSNLANPGSTSKNRETYQRKRDERDKSGTESRPEGVYRELV